MALENDGHPGDDALAADLTGIDVDCAAVIRDRVASAVGCAAQDVLLNSSHSHAAPWARLTGTKLGGGFDEVTATERAYIERLPYDFASAALLAWQARRPARCKGATGSVHGVAVNRRERTPDGRTILGWNPDLGIDEEIPTLRIDDLDGEPIATVTAFGCHPVVVGPDVSATGSDFVGPLRRRVEELRGGGVCVFLQGAAGNVLPLQAFFDHAGPEVPMGHRLGLESAHAVVDADPLRWEVRKVNFGSVTPISLYRRTVAQKQPDQRLAVASRLIDLPMLPPPGLEALSAELQQQETRMTDAVREGHPRSVTNPLQYHLNWLRSMITRVRNSRDGRAAPARCGQCASGTRRSSELLVRSSPRSVRRCEAGLPSPPHFSPVTAKAFSAHLDRSGAPVRRLRANRRATRIRPSRALRARSGCGSGGRLPRPARRSACTVATSSCISTVVAVQVTSG